MLSGKHILLGVSGGIAAYKAAALCSHLVKEDADVHVVMTANAEKLISPIIFDNLTGNRTATDTFDRNHAYQVEHISLARMADLIIVAPATANTLAKFAHGIADNMLTTTVLAATCPKIAAPAMNTNMYENPVTQDNLKLLRGYGWELLEPGSGFLACGIPGKGRMPEPEDILTCCLHAIAHDKDLTGKKVLVTAGPTQEALDPVRYLTNHSTGKMGYALAQAAADRGAQVTLVSGPTALTKPSYVETIDVISARDMFEAVSARSNAQDFIIKAAAVADYRPREIAPEKIKKAGTDTNLSLPLERTDDILSYLGAHKKKGQVLCGFAMETQNLVENSRKKLTSKNADLICANSLREEGAGFGTATNLLTLISKDQETPLPLMTKREAADRILDELLKLQNAGGQ